MNKIIRTRSITTLVIATLSTILILGCAEEISEDNNTRQKRVLEAYMDVYNEKYGTEIQPTESGSYILKYKEGSGSPIFDTSYIYIHYDTRTLDSTYLSTTNIKIAQRLGMYSTSNYYGPQLRSLRNGSMIKGIEEILLTSKEECYFDAIIPPWLSGSSQETGSSDNIRYTLSVERVIPDIALFEIDTMASYVNKYYNGLDSIAKGFYFKKIKDIEQDTIAENTIVSVKYIGRLLDGHVFDTNIADSAKKYGLAEPTGDFEIKYKSTAEEMTLSEDEGGSDLVLGLAKTLKNMSYGEEAVTIFNSEYGYGQSGKGWDQSTGAGVPPYQPLVFNIFIEEKE